MVSQHLTRSVTPVFCFLFCKAASVVPYFYTSNVLLITALADILSRNGSEVLIVQGQRQTPGGIHLIAESFDVEHHTKFQYIQCPSTFK